MRTELPPNSSWSSHYERQRAEEHSRSQTIVELYCTHHSHASPELLYAPVKSSPALTVWLAVVTVNNKCIGQGTATDSSGARKQAYVAAAKYLTLRHPALISRLCTTEVGGWNMQMHRHPNASWMDDWSSEEEQTIAADPFLDIYGRSTPSLRTPGSVEGYSRIVVNSEDEDDVELQLPGSYLAVTELNLNKDLPSSPQDLASRLHRSQSLMLEFAHDPPPIPSLAPQPLPHVTKKYSSLACSIEQLNLGRAKQEAQDHALALRLECEATDEALALRLQLELEAEVGDLLPAVPAQRIRSSIPVGYAHAYKPLGKPGSPLKRLKSVFMRKNGKV